MKTVCTVLVVSFVACSGVDAVPISLFSDTDRYIERSQDIVIARCVSVPANPLGYIDGFHPVEVEVLAVLKGEKKLGELTIGTVYAMKPGKTYLLSSLGGSAFGTDFLSSSQLSVVPIPGNFDLDQLNGKTTKEQVQIVFARHLYEIERQLRPLLEQQQLLQKAIEDKVDDQYNSKGEVSIGAINELTTTSRNGIVTLELDAAPLQWSQSSPGKTGFLYFSDHLPETPDWEFAPTDATDIEGLAGKPLQAKFFQQFSPSRDKRLGPSSNAILVSVGQVILARTVESPETIYALKIHEQSKDDEAMSVRFAIMRE